MQDSTSSSRETVTFARKYVCPCTKSSKEKRPASREDSLVQKERPALREDRALRAEEEEEEEEEEDL